MQKALRKLRRHGVASTLHLALVRLVNLVLPFKILRGMCVGRVEPAFLACPAGYRAAFLSRSALAGFAKDAASELSPRFVREALAAGDECLAICAGESLAAYGWYSTNATPAGSPELLLHFAPGYVYMYKGFTAPQHRGRRLHAIGKTHALRHYRSKGYRGLISYVESTNFDSLRSNARMGYETFGSIYVARILGRWFSFSTPGCRRFGFRIEATGAPAHEMRRGKA